MVRILDLFPVLIEVLTELEDLNPEAYGYRVRFIDVNFLSKFCIYVDFLGIFKELCKLFQERSLYVASITSEINNLVKSIENLFIGTTFCGWWNSQITSITGSNKYIFKDVKLDGKTDNTIIEEFANELKYACIESLQTRFPNGNITKLFSTYNFDEIKKLKNEDIVSHGREVLSDLLKCLNIELKIRPILDINTIQE